MKVTFVYPRFEKFLESVSKMEAESKFFTVGKFTCPPSLGIPILASLTPKDVEIAFVETALPRRARAPSKSPAYAAPQESPL